MFTDSGLPYFECSETIEVIRFSLEPNKFFSNDKDTLLYQYLDHLNPEVIIVDGLWLPMQPILKYFDAKKIITFRQVEPQWLQTPPLPDGSIKKFNPDDYDLVINKEPGFHLENSISVPPIIGVSETQVKPPKIIRDVLKVPKGRKLALAAHNGNPGELEKILEQADIDRGEYHLVSLSNLQEEADRLFPLSHYLSGVDLAIGGCGYNFFYETRFYDLPAIYIPQFRNMENQRWRLETNRNYSGPFNGADRVVSYIENLL